MVIIQSITLFTRRTVIDISITGYTIRVTSRAVTFTRIINLLIRFTICNTVHQSSIKPHVAGARCTKIRSTSACLTLVSTSSASQLIQRDDRNLPRTTLVAVIVEVCWSVRRPIAACAVPGRLGARGTARTARGTGIVSWAVNISGTTLSDADGASQHVVDVTSATGALISFAPACQTVITAVKTLVSALVVVSAQRTIFQASVILQEWFATVFEAASTLGGLSGLTGLTRVSARGLCGEA